MKLLGISLLLAAFCARGEEAWPQFLGPSRNLVYQGAPLAAAWPTEGPAVLWKKKTGSGFSGPVVSGDRVILFHRIGDQEIVDCLNLQTGEKLWSFPYPTHYVDDFGFDNGPRATPAISGGRVYTYGAEGMLHCLDLKDGKQIWSVAAQKEFGAPKGFFGIACSPLVDGEAVFLNLGGPHAAFAAFDKGSGKLLWKTGDDSASYSSPTVLTREGKRQLLFFSPSGLVALACQDGHEISRYSLHPRIRESVSAATPVVSGNEVFISACYGAGAALVRLEEGRMNKVWSSDDGMLNHYATAVLKDGYLYGFDGRQEQGCNLRCIEWKTGRVRWSQDNFGAGTVLLANDRLLVLTEKGELDRIKPDPSAFSIEQQSQILPFGVRAYPALSGGRFLARGGGQLVCLDLRPSNP